MIFRGGSDEDVSELIREIRAKAFEQGKSRDDIWMADYAGTCFTGAAERWYDKLPAKTRGSWELLKEALLNQYAPSEGGSSRGHPCPPGVRRGRIKLVSDSLSAPFYISRSRYAKKGPRYFGTYIGTTKASEALVVDLVDSPRGGNEKFLKVSDHNYVGIKWQPWHFTNFGMGYEHFACLSNMDEEGVLNNEIDERWHGTARSDRWFVYEDDNRMCYRWTRNGTTFNMGCVFTTQFPNMDCAMALQITPNSGKYMKQWTPTEGWNTAKMFFEPV